MGAGERECGTGVADLGGAVEQGLAAVVEVLIQEAGLGGESVDQGR